MFKLNWIRISSIISLFFILLFLPASFFDSGKSICISLLLFKKECPGCGMTRALMHLLHFDFKAAIQYNKMSFVVFPMIMFLTTKQIVKDISAMRKIESE